MNAESTNLNTLATINAQAEEWEWAAVKRLTGEDAKMSHARVVRVGRECECECNPSILASASSGLAQLCNPQSHMCPSFFEEKWLIFTEKLCTFISLFSQKPCRVELPREFSGNYVLSWHYLGQYKVSPSLAIEHYQ
jgi:hypothetical protein